jgi:hypothetical protein
MKLNKFFIGIFVLIIFLASCTSKNVSYLDTPCEVLQCLNWDNPKSGSPEYKNCKIVKLETNSDCLITYIKQIEVANNFLVISDMDRHLFVFDKNGNFVSQIGKYGVGPDEYVALNTFYIENDSLIVVIDDVRSALIKYDFRGKYLSAEKVKMEDIRRCNQAVLIDNDLILHNAISGFSTDIDGNMAYSIIDTKTLKLKRKYFSYAPIKLDNYIHFFSLNAISKNEEGADFIMPLNDTIFHYASSTVFPKYIIELPKKMASPSQIKPNTKSYLNDVYRLDQEGYFTGFTGIFETKNYIYLRCTIDVTEGYFFCDKTTQQGYYYGSLPHKIQQIPLFPIIHSFDNTLVGLAQPTNMAAYNFEFASDDLVGQQFNEILSVMQEDDNPILFFYEF